ncbi:hypothetical protein E4U11_002407 [Claviceps purpurea]|nr:hypothetical protein E4U11_002407 [Claviceps purpurea]
MNRNRQQYSRSRELPMPWSYKVDIWNLGLLISTIADVNWFKVSLSGKPPALLVKRDMRIMYLAAAQRPLAVRIFIKKQLEIDGDTLCVLEEAKHH